VLPGDHLLPEARPEEVPAAIVDLLDAG